MSEPFAGVAGRGGAAPPALPTDTRAHRRALHEKLCAELAAAAYDPCPFIGPSRSPASAARREACEPFRWVSRADPREPPTLAAFAYLDSGTAYVSVRGTDNARNYLSDLHATPTGRPRRHHGFDNCWRRLAPQVTAWLEARAPREVILIGHSLGGAIAQIAAFELAARWSIGSVVSFGAPLVGWREFAAAYDRTPIHGRPGVTLGDVTTTFVFKSDLVRTLLLPALGYRRHGVEIIIDEHGRPSGGYLLWYQEAMGTAWTTFVGRDDAPIARYGAVLYAPAPSPSARRVGGVHASAAGHDPLIVGRTAVAAPSLSLDDVIDKVRPLAAPVVASFPPLQAAVLAVGALWAAWLSVDLFRRDKGYHSVKERYVGAMAERVRRWEPLAFQERGDELLARGEAAAALSYATAALVAAEAEARSAGFDPRSLARITLGPRLQRAAAHAALGDHAAAIADLTSIIDSDPKRPIALATSADGRFAFGPQVTALRDRALAYELNGQWQEAMADYATLLAVRPDSSIEAFMALHAQARATVGAAGTLKTVLKFRAAEVEAESDRLVEQRKAVFEQGMARTWTWAHGRRADCAYRAGDFGMAIAEVTLALAADAGNASAYNLRGAAHARLEHRDEALADMTRAVEIEPGKAEFLYARGNARLMVGAETVPADDGSHATFIKARLRRGELALIEADLRRALALDPRHAGAKELLDRVTSAQVSPG